LVGDVQLQASAPPSSFPHHGNEIGEWNEGAVSGVSERSITCCGRKFFFFLIFFPIVGSTPVSGTARYLCLLWEGGFTAELM